MSRYTNQPEESKRKIKSLDLKIAMFSPLDVHASVYYVFHCLFINTEKIMIKASNKRY